MTLMDGDSDARAIGFRTASPEQPRIVVPGVATKTRRAKLITRRERRTCAARTPDQPPQHRAGLPPVCLPKLRDACNR
jgi:hypothetical protein